MPKPKFIYSDWAKNIPSENAPKYEQDKFWNREHERWTDGYSGITNYHYFFLTQCLIKSEEGLEIRPSWRDADEYVFEVYEQTLKKRNDLLIIKRRGIGLTTLFGGVVPMLNSMIYPGSTNLLTSASQDRINDMYANKLTTIYENLNSYIKPARSSKREGRRMFFAKKDNRTGEFSGLKSEIRCEETVKDYKAFEGARAKSIFIDEFFLHPFASDVRESVQACVRKNMMKIGCIVMGGSCGEDEKKHSSSQKISSAGIAQAEKIWKDAKYLEIDTAFIPAWMGVSQAEEYDENGNKTGHILNFCENGYSDEKKATEYILKTRERLSKAEDKKAYNIFVKNYPLNAEEVFSLTNQGILPPEVTQNVSRQKIYLMNNPPPVTTNDVFRQNNTILSSPNPNGKFVILENPQPNSEYISGTDPIGWNTQNIEEGSEYAIVIKKRGANTYVAYYKERNLNSSLVINNAIILQDYYNKAKTMLEMNQGAVAFKLYDSLGRLDLLAKRPDYLGIKFIDKKEGYGWYKNAHTQSRAYNYFIQYLINHCDKIYFSEALNEVNKFMSGNTDLLDAIVSSELYDNNILEKQKKIIPQLRQSRQIPIITRSSDGSTRTEWKTITT